MSLNILIAALIMGAVGFLFSVFLVVAKNKFHVEVDPRISSVDDALPGANCAGCGYASCSAYAEAVVEENAKINKCVVGGEETTKAIAKIMGMEASSEERKIAVVLCHGDLTASKFPGRYHGIKDCAAAVYSQDVSKRCKYGCVGLGSCVNVCVFDAIKIGENGIPIVDASKCTGCGACVEECPRNIIELHEVSIRDYVYCKSNDPTLVSRNVCKNACIGCGICVRAAAKDDNPDAIKLVNNLAVINFDPYTVKPEYGEKCPTKAFSRLINVKNLDK